MASFPLKKCIFSYPHLFNPKLENISLALHPQNYVCREDWHRTNYPCKTFFAMTQRLSAMHPLRTDRRTDGWETDDNHGQWYHRRLQHSCN